jgi:hypothetical protein
MMRTQYHFRQSERGLLAWDVHRLIRLSQNLPVLQFPIAEVKELDTNHWYAQGQAVPTCRSVVEHCALIQAAELSFPIILDASGRVMDGMHRVCRALLEGASHVPAVQFENDPEPDYVGREPGSLPYGSRT